VVEDFLAEVDNRARRLPQRRQQQPARLPPHRCQDNERSRTRRSPRLLKVRQR
jgi:hypothetical protein